MIQHTLNYSVEPKVDPVIIEAIFMNHDCQEGLRRRSQAETPDTNTNRNIHAKLVNFLNNSKIGISQNWDIELYLPLCNLYSIEFGLSLCMGR
jgi:hypothetical protein